MVEVGVGGVADVVVGAGSGLEEEEEEEEEEEVAKSSPSGIGALGFRGT